MAPKAKTPAPIDRPLSKAYLREFSGWSTAYPPGLSDPTSLRIMENVMINKDGSARIRPGLKYLSYTTLPDDDVDPAVVGVGMFEPLVGTHETFFLNDGTKAYLFAVRETVEIDSVDTEVVGFRVLIPDIDGSLVYELDAPEIGFTLPDVPTDICFSSSTTYVKYLQVNNRIFALSNNGEPMRYFDVGDVKMAKRLSTIMRPDWVPADKLTVINPTEAWIGGATATGTRRNLILDPSMFSATFDWQEGGSRTEIYGVTNSVGGAAQSNSLLMRSRPSRTNYVRQPLVTDGYADSGWDGIGSTAATFSTGKMNVTVPGGGGAGYAQSAAAPIPAGKYYKVAFDFTSPADATMFYRVRFFNSTGSTIKTVTYSNDGSGGRQVSPAIGAPAGTATFRVDLGGVSKDALPKVFRFEFVIMCESDEPTNAFDGNSTGDTFWTGTAGYSASVVHAPTTIVAVTKAYAPTDGSNMALSAYFRSAQVGTQGRVGLLWRNASGVEVGTRTYGSYVAITNTDWTARAYVEGTPPAGATQVQAIIEFPTVDRNEIRYFDAVLLEQISGTPGSPGAYFDGTTADTGTELHSWLGTPNQSVSLETEYTTSPGIPGGADTQAPSATGLISDTETDNDHSFALYYCFSNEVGDSPLSQVTIVRAQRPWNSWWWFEPQPAGGPDFTQPTDDPTKSCDQLVAIMPEAVYDAGIAAGAKSWSLFLATWSDQGVVPGEGVKVAEVDLTGVQAYDTHGWARVTPQTAIFDEIATLPSAKPEDNFSEPSTAGQGIVAADRMVLVYDPVHPARIQWSSNQQSLYHDFTSYKGGGLKTLTSGNMQIPASVKLWQNPQSVDTLTILNMGEDGRSSGYYMAPAEITSQSDSTPIMGFEETTATPGTVSPFGCEVLNNALYHPLEDQLMKSTASNYNITHKSMTDQIEESWTKLQAKDRIIAAQLDKRLYYLVNNPMGEPLEEHSNGNEIWVLDTESKAATWSRFLIQGVSLRKIEHGGRLYMGVVKSDGIYYLDPLSNTDDYVVDWDADGLDENDDPLDPLPPAVPEIAQRYIPWRLETNTQGANRAHDAWCHLQAILMNVGNFQGTMEWGVHSWDIHGKPIEKQKITRDLNDPDTENFLPFDLEDQLLIKRDVKEWFFHASSVLDEDGNVLPSFGQINSLQYRYLPVSVNIGYENGSVETFEYGRATENWVERTTDNGVPIPTFDQRRP